MAPILLFALYVGCGDTPAESDSEATQEPSDEGPRRTRDAGKSEIDDASPEDDEEEDETEAMLDAGSARPARESGAPSASEGDGGDRRARDAASASDAAKSDAAKSDDDASEPVEDAAAPSPGPCAQDLMSALAPHAPDDEDLAEDFAKYLRDEIGAVTCATEGSGTKRTITQPIFVPAGAVYDGKGETLTAEVEAMKCDTSEGEQGESQRPYFLLAPGAKLKNVTITYPGCEGVHMMGDNELDNILWEDAGEDAASVRSYFPGGKITIKNSKGHKAADKMFQFNAPCDVRVENFRGSDMGKLIRQNGGSKFKLTIDLHTVDVTGVRSAVVQSDSEQCFVRYHALTYMFTGSGDKSDRVFRDVPPANVTAY